MGDRAPYTKVRRSEGYPNGKEAVLKTAGRKPLQVRVLSPPPLSLTNGSLLYCMT